ncbi:MAG: hypothetical protein R3F24_07115 [Gammaproteobacteria bacterium]
MSANPAPVSSAGDLLASLVNVVGDAHVLTTAADREFFAMDVYNHLELPLAVVQPGTVDELQAVVRLTTAAGVAVVPRGGCFIHGRLPADASRLDTGRHRAIESHCGPQ